MAYQNTVTISWADMQDDAAALSKKLEGRQWKGIIAVTRGGMVPAALLSRTLDIKLIETLCLSSYEDQYQGHVQLIKKPEHIGKGEGWLVVDDLVDTGATYEYARLLFPEAYYACLYAKPKGAPKTDVHVKDFDQETWITFPWEVEE